MAPKNQSLGLFCGAVRMEAGSWKREVLIGGRIDQVRFNCNIN